MVVQVVALRSWQLSQYLSTRVNIQPHDPTIRIVVTIEYVCMTGSVFCRTLFQSRTFELSQEVASNSGSSMCDHKPQKVEYRTHDMNSQTIVLANIDLFPSASLWGGL